MHSKATYSNTYKEAKAAVEYRIWVARKKRERYEALLWFKPAEWSEDTATFISHRGAPPSAIIRPEQQAWNAQATIIAMGYRLPCYGGNGQWDIIEHMTHAEDADSTEYDYTGYNGIAIVEEQQFTFNDTYWTDSVIHHWWHY